MAESITLCLTMGEPAGIGGELTLRAWQARNRSAQPFFVIDDPARLEKLSRDLALPTPIRAIADATQAGEAFGDALPVLALKNPVFAEPGKPRQDNAAATIESIERAVGLVRSGKAAALVTNPIHKGVLAASGFPHPGHTEFLAKLAGGAEVAMMLASEELRVVPVTIHVALMQVPKLLDRARILSQGQILAHALREDFGIAQPRISVCGLNPHAGEDGTMGREEIEIIAPAIAEIRGLGIDARGPFPADSLFAEAARKTYDAVLCMYHDQALIPIKTLAMERAVNVTLGLPFIRTSPDHGTAFDIAGRGVASATSLLAAIDLAASLAARRQARGGAR